MMLFNFVVAVVVAASVGLKRSWPISKLYIGIPLHSLMEIPPPPLKKKKKIKKLPKPRFGLDFSP